MQTLLETIETIETEQRTLNTMEIELSQAVLDSALERVHIALEGLIDIYEVGSLQSIGSQEWRYAARQARRALYLLGS
jgi:serine kinase of HPr protein (carbohydrate metabolism regulator)